MYRLSLTTVQQVSVFNSIFPYMVVWLLQMLPVDPGSLVAKQRQSKMSFTFTLKIILHVYVYVSMLGIHHSIQVISSIYQFRHNAERHF